MIDIAKRQNPDLTDEELEDQIKANKVLNDKYSVDESVVNNVDNLRKKKEDKLSDKMLNNNGDQ